MFSIWACAIPERLPTNTSVEFDVCFKILLSKYLIIMSNTTVDDWLRSLGLLNYVQAFIDNGYDDLDICKQIGDEDLDAIGVINAKDRKDILASVQSLKSQGVNAVYFELEADVQPTVSKYVGQTDREKYRRDELINKMKSLLVDDNCVLQNNPVSTRIYKICCINIK